MPISELEFIRPKIPSKDRNQWISIEEHWHICKKHGYEVCSYPSNDEEYHYMNEGCKK